MENLDKEEDGTRPLKRKVVVDCRCWPKSGIVDVFCLLDKKSSSREEKRSVVV